MSCIVPQCYASRLIFGFVILSDEVAAATEASKDPYTAYTLSLAGFRLSDAEGW